MLFVNVTHVTFFINCKTKNSYTHKLAPKIWEPRDQGLFFQRGAKKRERGYVLLTQALQHSLTIKIVCSRKDTPPSTAEINNTPSPFLDMLYKFKTFINTPPPPPSLEGGNFLHEWVKNVFWNDPIFYPGICLKK